MDPITLDEQRLLNDIDRGGRVTRGQSPEVRSGVDVFPRQVPVEAPHPIRATRRLRRTFHPVRTRLVPVVLGLVVGALAPVFSLTGNTLAIFLLVPTALLARMTLHAVATSPARGAQLYPVDPETEDEDGSLDGDW